MTTTRKRPAVLRPTAHLTTRDAVWAAIRDLRAERPDQIFTTRDVARRVKRGDTTIARYLSRLVAAGIAAQVTAPAVGIAATYCLVRDVGVEPPRITRAGVIDDTPTDQERMWQAMKALPTFDLRDIMLSTGIAKMLPVRNYLTDLSRAGYLMTVQPGGRRSLARYRLLPARNTGPRPPAVRKSGQVFDRNLGRQVWPAVTP